MYEIKEHLENRNGELFIDGKSTIELAKEFDTPLYVYSENKIRQNARKLFEAFRKRYERFRLFYAVKANNNLAVLRILKEEGLGADVSDPAEIYLAKKAGFSNENILYSGTYHRNDELEYGFKEGVMLNLEDISQVNRLLKIGVPEFISFRINPGIGDSGEEGLVFAGPDAKFGIHEDNAAQAYRIAKEAGVKRFGIHMMTGSNVLNPYYFREITEKLLQIAGRIKQEIGIDFEFIDIGGGLGIPYRPGDAELDIEETADNVVSAFREGIEKHNLGNPFLMIEPGRLLVCEAGILLAKVSSIKDHGIEGYKKFIGVDAGMNTLLRPALYDAYHHILVANRLDDPCEDKANVCGPICENTDILAKDRELPRLNEGDLLAFLNVGAYGYGMSSQYNTRPQAAEVIVNNGQARLIRRRQAVEDMERDMVL